MLTPLELDIMKAIWRRPQATVRYVQSEIRPARKLAYTTVMTIMNRMYQKGLLTRSLRGRAHLYQPTVGYDEVRDSELARLTQNFFAGSRDNLMRFLGGEESEMPRAPQQSARELDESLL